MFTIEFFFNGKMVYIQVNERAVAEWIYAQAKAQNMPQRKGTAVTVNTVVEVDTS